MRSKRGKARILVVNCGSSSLKYKIIGMPDGDEIVRGEAERVGVKAREPSRITHVVRGEKRVVEADLADHAVALKKALGLIKEDAGTHKDVGFDAFAHRYVHPGTFFSDTARVDAAALRKLKQTLPLAPIHNPITYKLITFCHETYPAVKQYVVFDTAFHKTIPDEFAAYALPQKIVKDYHIRKMGFHGISHRYVMEEACRFLGRDKLSQRIISCHLGTGGSSICAIDGGRSINNSMGFTPLEGLMMNTRCGDIDPGVVFYIMYKEGFSARQTEDMLNHKSGVLGVLNSSSDLREAIRGMGGDPRAKMAFDMYIRRARSYVSFYALILKKADILIFTDSLGAGSPEVRQGICSRMDFLGISVDPEKNARCGAGTGDISSAASETKVLVVPTDEEIMIAREAYKELAKDETRR